MVPERRRSSRVRVDALVPIDLGKDNGGILLDLSEDGLRVRAVGRLKSEQITRLRFTLRTKNDRIETLGQIAWVDEAGTGGGVRFVRLPEPSHQQIRQWLALNTALSDVEPKESASPAATLQAPVAEPIPEHAETRTSVLPEAAAYTSVEEQAEESAAPSYPAARPSGATREKVSPVSDEGFQPGGYEVVSEFQPVLPESPVIHEFRLNRQQVLERTAREERRRKLVRRGVSTGLTVLAVIAGAVLYSYEREPINDLLGQIRELIATGTWPSGSIRPPITPTPQDKSTSQAAHRGRAKARPGPRGEPLSPRTAGPGGEAVGSAKPSGPPLEVSEANGQRRLVPYRGAAVVRLKDWSTVQVHARAGKSTPAGATAPESASAAPSTAPRASGREEASGGLAEQRQMPAYPPLALQNNVQGSVVLRALIGKDGTVQNVRLVSGPPILASAVLDAVRKWRYRPYLQNGEPLEVERQITVEFTIFTNEPASKGQNTTGPRP